MSSLRVPSMRVAKKTAQSRDPSSQFPIENKIRPSGRHVLTPKFRKHNGIRSHHLCRAANNDRLPRRGMGRISRLQPRGCDRLMLRVTAVLVWADIVSPHEEDGFVLPYAATWKLVEGVSCLPTACYSGDTMPSLSTNVTAVPNASSHLNNIHTSFLIITTPDSTSPSRLNKIIRALAQ